METIVTTIHFVVAIIMIGLILLQQGKGASMGASFGGGSSNTVFGSSGGATFFGKLTAFLAVTFFVTSLGLTLIARDKAQIDTGSLLPVFEVEETTQSPLSAELPALPLEQSEPQALPRLDELPTIEEDSLAPQLDSVESAAPTE